jgi:hypothetical protein
MGIGVILFGFGALFVLLLRLAIHALPTFAAVACGLWAYRAGAGFFGATAIGLLAGAGALIAGRVAFDATRSTSLRVIIALVFAAPAAMAGYNVILGLSQLGGSSELWRQIFAATGAATIGIIAAVRLTGHSGSWTPHCAHLKPPQI